MKFVKNIYRIGILDVLLVCIAKALTLQVKTKQVRGKESGKTLTSLTMNELFGAADSGADLGARWWMRGTIPRRVADSVLQLLRDLASVRGRPIRSLKIIITDNESADEKEQLCVRATLMALVAFCNQSTF